MNAHTESGSVRERLFTPCCGRERVWTMSVDKRRDLAEARIQEARQRGDFDALPGRNEPLELEELPGSNPEERFEALMLRSMGEVAAEVLIVRDIRQRNIALANVESPDERKRLLTALQEKRDELSAALRERKRQRHEK